MIVKSWLNVGFFSLCEPYFVLLERNYLSSTENITASAVKNTYLSIIILDFCFDRIFFAINSYSYSRFLFIGPPYWWQGGWLSE